MNRYIGYVHDREAAEGDGNDRSDTQASFRHGDGASRIVSVEIRNAGAQRAAVFSAGELMVIHVEAEFTRDVDQPIIGVLIRNRLGIDVYGTNTRIENHALGSFSRGQSIEVDFALQCNLTRQEYTVTAATQYWDGSSQDWLDDAVQFAVTSERDVAGVADLRASISWSVDARRELV